MAGRAATGTDDAAILASPAAAAPREVEAAAAAPLAPLAQAAIAPGYPAPVPRGADGHYGASSGAYGATGTAYGPEFDEPPPEEPETRGAIASCPCGTRVGNTLILWRTSPRATTFPRIGVVGPDWPCLTCTYTLIIVPSIAFLILVAPALHIGVLIGGILMFTLAVGALSLTACSNPGIVPKQTLAQMDTQRRQMEEAGMAGTFTVCRFCNVIRVEKTTHCYDCNVCVLELDHHCPWTGKCIGKYNLTYFYGFLFGVFGLIMYVGASTLAFVVAKASPSPG